MVLHKKIWVLGTDGRSMISPILFASPSANFGCITNRKYKLFQILGHLGSQFLRCMGTSPSFFRRFQRETIFVTSCFLLGGLSLSKRGSTFKGKNFLQQEQFFPFLR